MSDFSSLDLDQPTNNSSLIDNLRQPIWIALLTSVGVHAILGINLPKLSLFSEQAKLPPTVGLVELTLEQLENLPQPEEPEITFSNIPTSPTPNLFPPAPTPTPADQLPSTSISPSLEIPADPSDYERPKPPPEDSISYSTSTSTRTRSTPSVSRLPRNQSSIDEYSYNSSILGRSPLPTTSIYTSPLPNTNSQPIDTFQNQPLQDSNQQQQIDESQIRKDLDLTNKVFESGLSRRPTIEIDPNDGTPTTELSENSYSRNLQLPPRRYQDKEENKQENQLAITPNNSTTQTEQTPVATATPEAPAKPDPTKKNRLPEAPLVRQLREGKTMQDIVEEQKQSEKVAVVTPPPEKNNSQPEVEAPETPSPAPIPQPSPTPEQPKEFKGSLLDNFQKQRQQQVAETTPTPKPSPKPSPKPDDQTAAATVEQTKPPTPEVKETPSVAPEPLPVQQPTEHKGSLLQKFEEQRQQNAAVAEESESRNIALGGAGAYMEWAFELGLEEDNLTSPESISNVYPEAACERKLEGNALVGVLVNADGAIETGPQLLLDSGYPVLDEAALDAVSKRSFSSSDRSKLYQYELSFDSGNCSVAQPTPETESQEKTKPTEEGILIEVLPPEGE
ncbi:MAG: TonB family protein [Microcoleaceae cyanobacterium MO_207.B10]|nr:TonB family protein [Microcoleaceae cyanobacterium MO_207.B10]